MEKNALLQQIKLKYPDAIENYISDKYNFPKRPAFCYIPSRDLYIDIFNVQPRFWCEDYDESLHPEGDELITQSDEFMNNMMHIVMKNEKTDKEAAAEAQSIIDFWLDDMDKRRHAARDNNLNYVVFWDENLADAEFWLALDCPNGQDWKREYSWLPERDIDIYPLYKLTGKPMNLSKIVKHFQFFEFYWRELALWYNNDVFRNHGRLQGYLFANRYKYINKKPDELSDVEILRGLTISGVLRGYTTFDAKLMYEVIDKYQPKSIYDPCAGWGERMLASFCRGISYTGVDINAGLIEGYKNMMNYYKMDGCLLIHGDSAEYDLKDDFDMVVTCPPYGDIEYYSDDGAENLSYDEFLKWWKAVVSKIAVKKPKHFCFQINTKYRNDMLRIVEDAGYDLIDELYFKSNKSSHFNRKKNGVNLKTEKESMLVLEAK